MDGLPAEICRLGGAYPNRGEQRRPLRVAAKPHDQISRISLMSQKTVPDRFPAVLTKAKATLQNSLGFESAETKEAAARSASWPR